MKMMERKLLSMQVLLLRYKKYYFIILVMYSYNLISQNKICGKVSYIDSKYPYNLVGGRVLLYKNQLLISGIILDSTTSFCFYNLTNDYYLVKISHPAYVGHEIRFFQLNDTSINLTIQMRHPRSIIISDTIIMGK